MEPDVTCAVFFSRCSILNSSSKELVTKEPNFFFQKRLAVRVPFRKLIRSTALDVVLDLDFWGYIRRCVGGCATHTSF